MQSENEFNIDGCAQKHVGGGVEKTKETTAYAGSDSGKARKGTGGRR